MAIGEVSKSATGIFTEGYAPPEQYSTDIKEQGSFTDLYSVGAVIYKMITGTVPPSAPTRIYAYSQHSRDKYESLEELKPRGYDENFLKSIDRVLSLKAKERPQIVSEFQKNIAGEVEVENGQAGDVSAANSNKNGIIIGIIIAIMLLFVGGYVYIDRESSKVPTQSVNREVNFSDSKSELERTRQELTDLKRQQQINEEKRKREKEKREQEERKNTERMRQETEAERSMKEQEKIKKNREEKAEKQENNRS